VRVGTVGLLTRFPVKSTVGESLTRAVLDQRGLVHDRGWAAYTADGGIASGKTTRRFRKVDGMLRWRSAAVTGTPVLYGPDGSAYQVDDPSASAALSEDVGQPLVLRPETDIRHHDESGVHVITTSSIAAIARLAGGTVDPRRLRANIVLDTTETGFPEDAWSGADLTIGPEVVLRLGAGMPRCVMVDPSRAQPRILTTIGRAHDLNLGLTAQVVRPGRISVGDRATLSTEDIR
jgi:MOSC domain-containing protein